MTNTRTHGKGRLLRTPLGKPRRTDQRTNRWTRVITKDPSGEPGVENEQNLFFWLDSPLIGIGNLEGNTRVGEPILAVVPRHYKNI